MSLILFQWRKLKILKTRFWFLMSGNEKAENITKPHWDTVTPKHRSYSGVYHPLAALSWVDYRVFSLLSYHFPHFGGFILYFCTYMHMYEYVHVFSWPCVCGCAGVCMEARGWHWGPSSTALHLVTFTEAGSLSRTQSLRIWPAWLSGLFQGCPVSAFWVLALLVGCHTQWHPNAGPDVCVVSTLSTDPLPCPGG